MEQYLNRLRVISYLPEDILKNVRDKRLLALGYADSGTKKAILGYIENKYKKAFEIYEKSCEATVKAEDGLTIHGQFEKHPYIRSVPLLFNNVVIKKA